MIALETRPEREYFKHVTEEAAVAGAGDRLVLATMTFDPTEEPIKALMDEVGGAASRGAEAYALIDAHSFMVGSDAPGPLLSKEGFKQTPAPEFAHKLEVLQGLGSLGVRYAIINRPTSHRTLPVAGRSHIKTFIKNDTVNIGGCNLAGTEGIDAMVEFTHEDAADALFKLAKDTMAAGSVRQALRGVDQCWPLDEHTDLLIDAGVRNQSIILDKAMELVDAADEYAFMTCQFFPNSRTASHLASAHRSGVLVESFYNHPNKHRGLNHMIQQAVLLGERMRLPRQLFAHQMPEDSDYLHAKVIATDQGGMIGSNNYVTLGVRLGTAETAVVRRDPSFSRQLIETMRPRLVAEAHR